MAYECWVELVCGVNLFGLCNMIWRFLFSKHNATWMISIAPHENSFFWHSLTAFEASKFSFTSLEQQRRHADISKSFRDKTPDNCPITKAQPFPSVHELNKLQFKEKCGRVYVRLDMWGFNSFQVGDVTRVQWALEIHDFSLGYSSFWFYVCEFWSRDLDLCSRLH